MIVGLLQAKWLGLSQNFDQMHFCRRGCARGAICPPFTFNSKRKLQLLISNQVSLLQN